MQSSSDLTTIVTTIVISGADMNIHCNSFVFHSNEAVLSVLPDYDA